VRVGFLQGAPEWFTADGFLKEAAPRKVILEPDIADVQQNAVERAQEKQKEE
jgi:hypothetical protein